MIEIEGKQFSDEEILAEYRKCSDEYLPDFDTIFFKNS